MRKLMFTGVAVLLLCAAGPAAASTINVYPLPTYTPAGYTGTYVNELIDRIALAPSGALWWTGGVTDNIGEIIPSQATPGTTNGEHLVQLTNVQGTDADGLVIGADGSPYFGLWNSPAIWKLDPTSLAPSKVVALASVPEALAVSPVNHDIFAALGNWSVSEYSGGAIPPVYGPVSDPDVFDVAVDASGNAWVPEDGRGGSNYSELGELLYGTGGTLHEFLAPSSGAIVQHIAIDHSGDVWFTDRANNKIGELIPAQTQPGTSKGVSEYPIPRPTGGDAYEQPQGITVASDGSVWFTEAAGISSTGTADNQVGEVTPTAPGIVAFAMQPTPDGAAPGAIGAGVSGAVWYAGAAELGQVTGAGGGGAGITTGSTGATGPTGPTSPLDQTSTVESISTSNGQTINITTAPGQSGYAALDQHLLGGLNGDDIAKLLANGGFSIQIPLTYPAYAGNYSASGSGDPQGIPGYEGDGAGGGDSLVAQAAAIKGPIQIFSYSHTFKKPGKYHVKIGLTAAGKKLLKAALKAKHALPLTIVWNLKAKGHTTITHHLTATLKPR